MDAMMITGGQGFTGRHITQRLAAGGRRAIFGLLTRWISLALLPVMSGALLTHLPNGWTFHQQRWRLGVYRFSHGCSVGAGGIG